MVVVDAKNNPQDIRHPVDDKGLLIRWRAKCHNPNSRVGAITEIGSPSFHKSTTSRIGADGLLPPT